MLALMVLVAVLELRAAVVGKVVMVVAVEMVVAVVIAMVGAMVIHWQNEKENTQIKNIQKYLNFNNSKNL